MDTAEHDLPNEVTRILSDDVCFEELEGEVTRPHRVPGGDKRPHMSYPPAPPVPASVRPAIPQGGLKPPPPPPPAPPPPRTIASVRPPAPSTPPGVRSLRAPPAPGAAELAQALLVAHAQYAASHQARRAEAAGFGSALLAKVQQDFAPSFIPPPPPPSVEVGPYLAVPELPTDAGATPLAAGEREELDALRPGIAGWVHKIVRFLSRR